MKYRPLGSTGAAVSSLCLSIGEADFAKGPGAVKALIIAGLEAGINAYHFDSADAELLQTAGEALSHVERTLIWIGISLGGPRTRGDTPRAFTPEQLSKTVEEALHGSGLGWFDVVVLDEPAEQELTLSSLNTLKALRSSGQVRMLGIKGDAPVTDTYISTGAFDALYTPYSVNTHARIHTRMREAQRRDLAVFIYDYDREVRLYAKQAANIPPPKKKTLMNWLGLTPEEQPQTVATSFDFMHNTPGWQAHELCLNLVLTNPTVSSALISVEHPSDIEGLAKALERHLPAGIAAQIEMARVG
jgi:aryl-alcohol dehydrogenase-like predicted oxidoreductase